MNEVLIEEKYELGDEGIDQSANGPMYRALSNLMLNGRPGDRSIALYFVETNPERARWLGVLTYTLGERLLFFPSTRSPYRVLENSLGEKRSYVVDHLTLEDSYRRSHITSPGSKKHTSTHATKQIGGAYHWFTVHYQNSVFLHPLTRKTIYRFKVPRTDTDRRMAEFENSRTDIAHHIVRLNPAVHHGNHDHVGFSFFAGKPGFKDIQSVPSTTNSPATIGNAIRTHRIAVDGHTEVQITSFLTSEYLERETAFYF